MCAWQWGREQWTLLVGMSPCLPLSLHDMHLQQSFGHCCDPSAVFPSCVSIQQGQLLPEPQLGASHLQEASAHARPQQWIFSVQQAGPQLARPHPENTKRMRTVHWCVYFFAHMVTHRVFKTRDAFVCLCMETLVFICVHSLFLPETLSIIGEAPPHFHVQTRKKTHSSALLQI